MESISTYMGWNVSSATPLTKESQQTNHHSIKVGVLRTVEKIGLEISVTQSNSVGVAVESLKCLTINNIDFVLTNAITKI